MSRHGVLAAGLAAALLLLPRPTLADEPPPGFFPDWFKPMQSGAKASFPRLPRTLEGAVNGYTSGRVADAEAVLKPLVTEKIHNESYPLYLLTLGSVDLALGDYQGGERTLSAALTNMSVELEAVSTGIALVQAESERPYRGYPHEKMLAHTYLGLSYFQQHKYEDARIEFTKAREVHKGKAAGQENDFLTGHFLEGLNAIHDRRFNDAQVSFRRVTELKKDWPLGWYALCRASELARSTPEADEAWVRYEALVPAEARLARDGTTPCVLFLVESGRGPVRKPDAITEQLGSWEAVKEPEIRISLGPEGQARVDAPSVDDLYFQASTQGGLAGDAARKVVSSIAKAGVRNIPLVGGFLAGKNEVDLRCWSISPGRIHLAAVPVPGEPSTIELVSSGKSGRPIAADSQVFRFIRGQPFEQAPVVYARILPNADTRATLHDSPH